MNLASVVNILGGVAGLLAVIGGAAVYLRASFTKARIEALTAEIEDEKRRSAQLRLDVTELKSRNAALEARVVALNELVTQRAQLEGLQQSIELLRRDIANVAGAVSKVG